MSSEPASEAAAVVEDTGRGSNKQQARKRADSAAAASDKAKELADRCVSLTARATAAETAAANARRRADSLQRECDGQALELKREAAVRAKLELLCRELQKQNKLVLEESSKAAEAEAERRSALASSFESGLKDITTRLDEQSAERVASLAENEALRTQLEKHVALAADRQALFDKSLEAKDAMLALLQAKLGEAAALLHAEEQRTKLAQAEAAAHAAAAAARESDLTAYGAKFEEVKTMMQDSHAAFAGLRAEMEKLAKRARSLEKEKEELLRKTKASDAALLQLLDERNEAQKAHRTAVAQKEALAALCRTLQERAKSGGGGAAAAGVAAAAEADDSRASGDSAAS